MKTRRCGFTMVELLTVIGIIAVLAALIFPAVHSALIRGKITKTGTAISALGMALKQYETDFGSYPDWDANGAPEEESSPYLIDEHVLHLLLGGQWEQDRTFTKYDGNPVGERNVRKAQRWNGPYLEAKQKDFGFSGGEFRFLDAFNNPFHLRFAVNATSGNPTHNPDTFDIWSDGPDGIKPPAQRNDKDDVTNWK